MLKVNLWPPHKAHPWRHMCYCSHVPTHRTAHIHNTHISKWRTNREKNEAGGELPVTWETVRGSSLPTKPPDSPSPLCMQVMWSSELRAHFWLGKADGLVLTFHIIMRKVIQSYWEAATLRHQEEEKGLKVACVLTMGIYDLLQWHSAAETNARGNRELVWWLIQ